MSQVDRAGFGRLPALYTQPAPVLDWRSNNNHTEFVINQKAGGGLRDFACKFQGRSFCRDAHRA